MSLNASDWIQVILAILTFLGLISTIVIAIFTLKQNSKMIEESTRPYVLIYKDTISINTPTEYLVIKNFGSSVATITSLNFDLEKFKTIFIGQNTDFDLINFSNITLAPNQKYYFPISTKGVKFKKINFDITYKNSTKTYHDSFEINLKQDHIMPFNKQHKIGNKPEFEIITISNSLQELIKRL